MKVRPQVGIISSVRGQILVGDGVGVGVGGGGGGSAVLRAQLRDSGVCVSGLCVLGLVAVQLHVFAQGAGVGVALVAAPDLAHVGFVTGVHVGVLLAVAAVREPPVAALELAFKRFFT